MIAQLAGAVEYTDCISAEGLDSPNECSGYDTKQSDDEVLVMVELWRMRSTPLMPLLQAPLGLRVVVPNRVLSIGQIELNCNYAKLNWLVGWFYGISV